MQVTNLCPACAHELTQKSPVKLSLAGVALITGAIPLLFHRFVWPAAILLAATGIYLLIGSLLGKGKWCKRCKKFPVPKSLVG
jgi:hypothetical protein